MSLTRQCAPAAPRIIDLTLSGNGVGRSWINLLERNGDRPCVERHSNLLKRSRQSLLAGLLFIFIAAPAAAQPIVVSLLPGDVLEATCQGEWADIITAPDVSARCAEGPPPPPTTAIVVDHTSVALFDQIPPTYRTAAAALRLLLRTASVGQNISSGLNCLVNNASNFCRTGFGVPAAQVPIVSQPQYGRAAWLLEFRGNPGWRGKVDDIISQVNSRSASFDFVTLKQSYVDDASLAQFWDPSYHPGIAELESLAAAHPNNRIIYMTAAISKLPQPHIFTFNVQMRSYTAAEQQPLFDLADLESHRPDGSPCLTSGVPTICAEYNTEVNGGHLTNGMAQQRVAKAFWVLMARLAGWQP
jgi:hypothetical protein